MAEPSRKPADEAAATVRDALTYWLTETRYGRSHAPEALAALVVLVAAAERADRLAEAGRRWLAETSPGQHITSAKGRGMMQQALREYDAALADDDG